MNRSVRNTARRSTEELLTFTEKDFERPLTRYEELALAVEENAQNELGFMFNGLGDVRSCRKPRARRWTCARERPEISYDEIGVDDAVEARSCRIDLSSQGTA